VLRRLAGSAILALVTACAALAGCSGGGSGGSGTGSSCDTTFDTDKPDVCPSWTTDVAPLVVKYCDNCHTDGGPGMSLFNATSWSTVHSGEATMATWVNNCGMPLVDATPPQAFPSDAERQTMLSWIACGSPDN
jgi:hypothetical protein